MDKPKLLKASKELVQKIQKEKDPDFQKRLVNPLKRVSNLLAYTQERFIPNPTNKNDSYIYDLLRWLFARYKDALNDQTAVAYVLGTVARMLNFETAQNLNRQDPRNRGPQNNYPRNRNNRYYRR
ncbi:MAG: hypothetical protein PWP37_1351 [Thermotogota bacterium]|nr:hypothetical protein [Thermotogota bacterium]